MKVSQATTSTTPSGVIKKIKRLDPYASLPKKTRKKIVRLVKLAKLKGKIPRSAQQTIPYEQMMRGGTCRLAENRYNRTLEFGDVNYRLARTEDKEGIFDAWSRLLNSFDSSVSVQLSFINQRLDPEQYEDNLSFPERDDGLDMYRDEYTNILQERLRQGNNGLVKRKFITFGLQSDSMDAASLKLERMEGELLTALGQLHSQADKQNGYQRLELLHDIYNIGTDRKLNFNWSLIAKTGFTTKDFISPNYFDFSAKNYFELPGQFGRASFLQINASELSDDMLSELLDMDSPLIVTLHLQSVDRTVALKQVKGLLSDIQKMTIEEQMKAARQGYDMDILPPDLVDFKDEAQELLNSLKDRDERMFCVTVLLVNFADTLEELDNRWFTAKQICQKHNCELLSLDWQQEAGLIASSPIGVPAVEIQRILTTSSTAIFIPFQTQELFMQGGQYYGVNTISKNLIMVDRKAAQNMNGLILGKSGSGKSFATKREIVNAFFASDDDILINDPEREYPALVKELDGQVIKVSATSPHHLNPLDINLDISNDEDTDYDPIRSKSDFVLSFCEHAAGGRDGLTPREKTVIDRCVQAVYVGYLQNPIPENMPILEDLYNELRQQSEPEAENIAGGLELYVHGSLNVFNHRTNVDINNRIVCFDTKDLGKHLQKLGMLVVQEQIWGRVTINRSLNKFTRYYLDEIHKLLRDPQSATATVEMWKRFRKWGGMLTGITQNVSDFMLSKEIEAIFSNSEFFYLLNQAATDRQMLAQMLGISAHQLEYVTDKPRGRGLLIFQGTIIPFEDEFPTDTELYRLMSTKLQEVV